jgi:hypothetical protein
MPAVARLVLVIVLAIVGLVPSAGAAPAAGPSPATLLARHVPVLVLHPAEQFSPVPVQGFLADSDLQRSTAAGWEKVPGPVPAGGAGLRLDQRSCLAVEGAAATSCYESTEAAHGASPVVYGAAFRSGNQIALQYWLWYPWNVYSPTVSPGDLWQVHEGDWESVSVILDREGRPRVVGLSAHCNGTRRPWAKAAKRGARPLVYVALGSHANFFGAGTHGLDPRCPNAPLLIEVIESYGAQPVDRTANGRVVRPRLVRVAEAKPAWMAFAGAWGEDAYVHFPGNEPIRYGSSPRGPAFHEQWRRPVAEVLSWPRG